MSWPAPLTAAEAKRRQLARVAWLIAREGECLAELARIQEERRDARAIIHDLNRELGR